MRKHNNRSGDSGTANRWMVSIRGPPAPLPTKPPEAADVPNPPPTVCIWSKLIPELQIEVLEHLLVLDDAISAKVHKKIFKDGDRQSDIACRLLLTGNHNLSALAKRIYYKQNHFVVTLGEKTYGPNSRAETWIPSPLMLPKASCAAMIKFLHLYTKGRAIPTSLDETRYESAWAYLFTVKDLRARMTARKTPYGAPLRRFTNLKHLYIHIISDQEDELEWYEIEQGSGDFAYDDPAWNIPRFKAVMEEMQPRITAKNVTVQIDFYNGGRRRLQSPEDEFADHIAQMLTK